MKYCDLHTHSAYSDGSLTPAQLVAEAKKLDLTIALTDHNTVAGLPEFLRQAQEQGVNGVPGIELSTVYGEKELHLLGLFIMPEHYDAITNLMQEYHALKEESNIALIRRLNAAGYDIDYASVQKRNLTGRINRAHIAAELYEKGYVSTVRSAFNDILDEKKGFYVPPKRLSLFDAIRFLRSIHAVPVLAHPLQDMDAEQLRRLLPKAVETGLLGMEVLHSSYNADQRQTAASLAEEFGLAKSGGSDFHGSNKPDIHIGTGRGNLEVPLVCLEELKKRIGR